MSQKGLSLFQRWILLMLFDNIHNSLTKEEMSLKCCDSSLDEVSPNQINSEIHRLTSENYLRQFQRQDGYLAWSITPEGILYVRKYLINPLVKLMQRTDFDQVIEKITPQSKDFLLEAKAETAISKHEIDKEKFSRKVTKYGIENIGMLINLVTAVLNIINKTD